MGFGRTNSCTPVKKTQEKTVSIMENGPLEIVPDSGYDAMSKVIADVGVELQYNRLHPAATGTFTPAERTLFNTDAPLIIEHNAGIIPFVVMVKSNGMLSQGDLDFIVSWRIPHRNVSSYDKNVLYSVSSRRASSSSYRNTRYGEYYSKLFHAWDMEKVAVAQGSADIYVNSGKTYTWTVYGIE